MNHPTAIRPATPREPADGPPAPVREPGMMTEIARRLEEPDLI